MSYGLLTQKVMHDALHQIERAGSPETYDVKHLILTERISSELSEI